MILILSAARSGSTWLAKVLDSHPRVLYLHEPDIEDRGIDLIPVWFGGPPSKADLEGARKYISRLEAGRSLRAAGSLPFFRKDYRGPFSEAVRRSIIVAGKGIESFGLNRISKMITVPDLSDARGSARVLVKSVSSLGRTEAFLSARPDIQPLILIRHPCGFVSSMLRGYKRGLMHFEPNFGRLLQTRSARALGLTEGNASDVVSALAWLWLISYAEALNGLRKGQDLMVFYEDIAASPGDRIPPLLDHLGLSFHEQTKTFLYESQKGGGRDSYYSVFRDQGMSQEWTKELDAHSIAVVKGIVSRHEIGLKFKFPD